MRGRERKGLAISLDAVVAVSFFMFVLILIAGQTYQPRSPGTIYLKQLTLDTLSVAEKTGRIGDALAGNGSALDELLSATPDATCISISILDESEDEVASYARIDCVERGGLDIQVSARPYIHRGSGYIIRTESWFRKEDS